MDIQKRVEVKFDPREQEIRYIETRMIEHVLLMSLENVYKQSLEKDGTKKSERLEYVENNLRLNLEQKYNSWQSFYDDRPGLDSGGVGEAITRMVGVGILEDFPLIYKVTPQQSSEYGVKILKKPQNESDKSLIDVVIKIENVAEYMFAKFRFNTSLNKIRERQLTIKEEIEKGRAKFQAEL